jgi:cellulose synthase/poly-beta-1,6-N-acetylglucosamine synthase-like glycosyltransferase
MKINNKREILLARISLFATSILFLCLFGSIGQAAYEAFVAGQSGIVAEAFLLATAIFFVGYGNFLYHICLIGHYSRCEAHVPTPRAELDAVFENAASAPKLSVLVPSYKEERNVIWQTMMSAALAEYPSKNVILLIDDPYHAKALPDIVKLEDTRLIPSQLQALFDAPAAQYGAVRAAFEERVQQGELNIASELHLLAEQYDNVAAWLSTYATDMENGQSREQLTFSDRFFLERIIDEPMQKHRQFAQELRAMAEGEALPPAAFLLRHYARLTALFNVSFASFERKKYSNLSHEANKAMNLNSYIALVGKHWREVTLQNGDIHLVEATSENADFLIPDADYINTIDADSLMLGEYALRLIHTMEAPGNEKLAVMQSPCSSIQGAPKGLERTAGACIDVQFRTHQGYTYWGASFWVGANAMLRRSALEEIREVRMENGYPISIYIQDRTVIEDTESTIDLVHKGWRLYNYPERMTFSANPPDFGSLLIQRRRWSNGGIIILPKLLRYVLRSPKNVALFKELFMRFHYLASTTTCCVAALLFVFYPFHDSLSSGWLGLSILPFFCLFIRDLKNTGYKASDALRICAMNLMLLPIVIGGVMKSFEQILTGKKIPFSRTPKIPGRTAAPALYSLAALLMPAFFGYGVVLEAAQGHTAKAIFASINVVLSLYALFYFVGVRAALEDTLVAVRTRLRRRFYRAEVIELMPGQPTTPAPQMAVEQSA